MRKRMHGNFMPLINFFYLRSKHLVVPCAADVFRPFIPKKPCVEIERRLQAVFIQNFNCSYILRYAVVKTKRNRLFLTVPPTFTYLRSNAVNITGEHGRFADVFRAQKVHRQTF